MEIGPLHDPLIDKRTHSVWYVDHAPTDELRAKYAEDLSLRDNLESVAEVDYVWKGDVPLAKVVDSPPYDYVVASHVMEHVPDPIGWLGELSDVLVDGGLILLALPDKRFCFDVNRSVTEIADLIDCHLRELRAPSFGHIYDFWSKIVPVDTAAMWRREVDYSGAVRHDTDDADRDAYRRCLESIGTGGYTDVHCHVFTPSSFLELYSKLVHLGLIDSRIVAFEPTPPGSLEFLVALEKLSGGADSRRRAQEASIPRLADPFEDGSARPAGPPPQASRSDAVQMPVSRREQALVLRKRRVLEALRRRLP